MGIEALGKSLLSSAKKKSKKQEKKAKLFTGLMLGVQVGNYVLRNKAKKRAEEFWKSNQGAVASKVSQFDNGVNFWKDDKSMRDTHGTTGVDDWEAAKRAELYKFYKANDLGGAAPKDLQKFKSDVNAKITDEINAYGEKRELYKNFRNIGRTETALTEAKTAYVKPLKDKLEKGAEIINQSSSVGGYLLGNLGLFGRGKANLEEVVIDEQRLMLPVSYNEVQKEKLALELRKNTTFQEKLSNINHSVVYTPLTPDELKAQIDPTSYTSEPDRGHARVFNLAISGAEVDRQQTLLDDVKFSIGGKNRTIYEFFDTLTDDDPSGNRTMLAASQILALSKETKRVYELENVNRMQEDTVRPDDFFVAEGFRTYIAMSFTDNGKPQDPKGGISSYDSNLKVELTFPNGNKSELKLGRYDMEYSKVLRTYSKEEAHAWKENFKTNTPDFEGKDTFLVQLKNKYNLKYKLTPVGRPIGEIPITGRLGKN
tara:strand:+ start:2564 stop:4015 length:1452 start_codon:yes stop_codon:yes gene_type:complete